MEKLKSVDEFRERLRTGNSRHAVLVVGGAAMIMIVIDFILGLSINQGRLLELLMFMGLLTIYLGVRFFYGGTSKKVYIPLYIMVHAVVIWGFSSLVTIPSPLLAFLVVISLSVYLELHYIGLAISISAWTLGILLDLRLQGIVTTADHLYIAIAYLLAISFMIYYATIFLRIADEELVELDKSTLQNEFERLRVVALINNLNDAVVSCDEKFVINIANPKAQEVISTVDGLTDKYLPDVMDIRDAQGLKISFEQLINKNRKLSIHTKYRLHYSDTDFINIYIAISSIENTSDHAELSGYVVLLRDITRQKSLEDERTEFISIMSHELRTPVSIVEGGISLAQSLAPVEADKLKVYLEKAHDQTLMLAEIVNSLSIMINSERGVENTRISETDCIKMVQKMSQTYEEEAKRKGLTLTTKLSNNLPLIYTNQEYLYEIIQNLITNALKYTKQGGITITVSAPDKDHVDFAVSDTGIGINTADQVHVFERFWRSEDFRTRESNGTGLGLYITQKLANSIGAKILLESEINKGSTFTLRIPIAAAKEI